MRRQTTEKTHSHDGSLTISELHRRAQAWADEQPMHVSCAFGGCGWDARGPAAAMRDAALVHRAEAHPEAMRAPRGRRARIEAEVAAARARRAQREDDDRVAKIEAGRRRETAAVLEEVAADGYPAVSTGDAECPPGEPSATSSSTYTPKPGSRPARILELLAAGTNQFGAIADALDVSQKKVGVTLGDLVAVGAIVRVARGVYALPGAAVSERDPQAEEARGCGAALEPTASASAVRTARTSSRSETAPPAPMPPADPRSRVRDTFSAMRHEIDRLERELLDEIYRNAA